jgi:subtilisin family serine protease
MLKAGSLADGIGWKTPAGREREIPSEDGWMMPQRRWLVFVLAALLVPVFGQEAVPGRYIVEFTGEPAIRHARPERRRSEIRGEQRMAEAWLRARGARVRARLDTVLNAAVVEAADVSLLRRMPGVRRVTPVRAYELFLIRALEIHRAAAAWDLAGGMEQAGKGVKIGILDTGIDPRHPGFRPPDDWAMPEGYPRVSQPEQDNLELTNAKIIVARSYDGSSARDKEGHGTAVAMVAAGLRHESPRGAISGMAPAAWLGVYRVSNPRDGLIYSDVVLQALDDAVKDGMDVINMSFGSVGALPSDEDPLADAVSNAIAAGIVVVNAAGNTSGPMTVDDTAAAEKVIAAGSNDPAPETQVVPSVGAAAPAQPSSNVVSHEPVMAPLVDAAWFGDRYGCKPYPDSALNGKIPLIERGVCFFHEKLANAAAAGAPAAVVFNTSNPASGSPEDLIIMNVDENPTIPGMFIRNSDGTRLKEYLTFWEDLQVTLRFPSPEALPDRISSFSSRGPSVDLRIKPDVLATGSRIYTAAVMDEPWVCGICDPSGYTSLSGTSFSAPLVAGAAAVLKAARPGLSVDDYRSMLINAAHPFLLSSGDVAPVNSAGAGILDAARAVRSVIAADPVSISFGGGEESIEVERELRLRNLSDQRLVLALEIESADGARPEVAPAELTIEPHESASAKVRFAAAGLSPGVYQGFVLVKPVEKPAESGGGGNEEAEPGNSKTDSGRTAANTRGEGTAEGEGGEGEGDPDADPAEAPDPKPAAPAPAIRVPYWYGVKGSAPDWLIVVRRSPSNAKPGSVVRVYFRIHDLAGLPVTGITPRVVPVSGGGRVLDVKFSGETFPNSYRADVVTGPFAGPNVFQVEVDGRLFTFQVTASN